MRKNVRWSVEEIRQWYQARPWMRGCNFLPSDCCNRVAFWQSLDFEKHLATADRELELAASIGFNSIRVLLELIVYEQEHDSFLERFERFLATADKHRISVVVCFGNDCTVPKNANYRPPHLGVQEFDWGYHGGRKNSPHVGKVDGIGWSVLDEPESAAVFFNMVREIITLHAEDRRIAVWDLFNEPGNGNRKEISVPHVKKIFEVARECAPSQPLTTGIWHTIHPTEKLPPADDLALELSDIISYHCYGSYDTNVRMIARLKKYNRPLMNTEWLHRIQHDNVELMFPLFCLERVGCWNWGFVAGLSQTYEPWEWIWRRLDAGETGLDITKWQHDLFHPNLRPYDPAEIEIIRSYSVMADEELYPTENFPAGRKNTR